MASVATLAEAVNALVSLTSTALTFSTQISSISQIVAKAQSENRTQLTPEEWQQITDADGAARNALVDAIVAAKARGS